MGVVVKGVLGRANRPGLVETAQSVRDWGESVGRGAASITEPVSSTRLAANLLCLASKLPFGGSV